MPASVEIAKHTLMAGGLILAIGTVTGLLAQKIKIPDVAVFLLTGMLIGPQALGLIDIKADSALNQIVLLFGASYVLFDGGASLRFSVLKRVWITIVILAAVLVSSGNATVRYIFSNSSNAWLELQWYLFSAVFILCSGYTLMRNEHIRIDIVNSRFPKRVRIWIDIIGGLFFLLPMTLIIMSLSWPIFVDSFGRNEVSLNAGGLLQWPFKLIVPVGFLLLALQGISEIIKRVGFLMGLAPDPTLRMRGHGEEAHAK